MNKSHVIAGAPASRVRIIAYWVATAMIVFENGLGSEWDFARISLVRGAFDRLGYPYYLMTITGVWKILAVAALLVPRFPRAKEWAYAGILFIYTGAIFSHLYVGEAKDALSPLFLSVVTVVSWSLRPESRRLSLEASGVVLGERKTRARIIIYWVSTILVALLMVAGGLAQLFREPDNVKGIIQLGFPVYFLSLLGFWKVAGGIALVLPRWGLFKEWAYAGIIFDLTGAAASNAFCGNASFHIIAPLILAAMTVVSWATRPASRWAGGVRSVSL
jgi:uncharacterized membrane protein YphA (DoxX/SURF4 family)